MVLSELRVILKNADLSLHNPSDRPDQQQVATLRAIGKILLVMADLELSKAEKEARE